MLQSMEKLSIIHSALDYSSSSSPLPPTTVSVPIFVMNNSINFDNLYVCIKSEFLKIEGVMYCKSCASTKFDFSERLGKTHFIHAALPRRSMEFDTLLSNKCLECDENLFSCQFASRCDSCLSTTSDETDEAVSHNYGIESVDEVFSQNPINYGNNDSDDNNEI